MFSKKSYNLILEFSLDRTDVYISLEKYPIDFELAKHLAYAQTDEEEALFLKLHEAEWNKPQAISPFFTLQKVQKDLLTFNPSLAENFDLIYYDAFSPERQAELWQEEVFQRLAQWTKNGGILTTYCAKGEVRRRLQRSGFMVERLAGPKGKREVLRATRQKQG